MKSKQVLQNKEFSQLDIDCMAYGQEHIEQKNAIKSDSILKLRIPINRNLLSDII